MPSDRPRIRRPAPPAADPAPVPAQSRSPSPYQRTNPRRQAAPRNLIDNAPDSESDPDDLDQYLPPHRDRVQAGRRADPERGWFLARNNWDGDEDEDAWDADRGAFGRDDAPLTRIEPRDRIILGRNEAEAEAEARADVHATIDAILARNRVRAAERATYTRRGAALALPEGRRVRERERARNEAGNGAAVAGPSGARAPNSAAEQDRAAVAGSRAPRAAAQAAVQRWREEAEEAAVPRVVQQAEDEDAAFRRQLERSRELARERRARREQEQARGQAMARTLGPAPAAPPLRARIDVPEVVDLTALSSDSEDEVREVGADAAGDGIGAGPARQAGRAAFALGPAGEGLRRRQEPDFYLEPRRRLRGDDIRAATEALDRTVERRREQLAALVHDAERGRIQFTPPNIRRRADGMAIERPRITLGGAVERRGGVNRVVDAEQQRGILQQHLAQLQNLAAGLGDAFANGRRIAEWAGGFMGGFGGGGAGAGGAAGAGPAGGAGAGAGAGAGVINPQAVIAEVTMNPHPAAMPRFTQDFDLEGNKPIVLSDDDDEDDYEHAGAAQKKVKGAAKRNERKKKRSKPQPPRLCCLVCQGRLLLADSCADDAERVWALRCGHLLHYRCLVDISTPGRDELDRIVPPGLDVLGQQEEEDAAASSAMGSAGGVGGRKRKRAQPKRGKKGKVDKGKEKEFMEWEWSCPVAKCARPHASVRLDDGGWVQRPGRGGLLVYM